MCFVASQAYDAPYPPADNSAAPNSGNSSRLVGVGVVFRRDGMSGRFFVDRLHPDGPADRSGAVRPGDVLVAVDRQSVAGITSMELHDLVAGPEGTPVELQLQR